MDNPFGEPTQKQIDEHFAHQRRNISWMQPEDVPPPTAISFGQFLRELPKILVVAFCDFLK